MELDLWTRVFVTMLVILDPIGNVPVFLSLTDNNPERRDRLGLQATLVAAGVILSFAAFGQAVLGLLGISIPAIEVAGGLLLVLVALELLQPHGSVNTDAARVGNNPALVPLGTPLLAGPGAIAATMVYIRSAHTFTSVGTIVAAFLAALIIVYLALRFAARIGRLIGANGIELLSRVVGLLLAAIAVQLVATGVQAWVRHGVR